MTQDGRVRSVSVCVCMSVCDTVTSFIKALSTSSHARCVHVSSGCFHCCDLVNMIHDH